MQGARASANLVTRMPTWDVQRGATGFTNLHIENEWLGNPHSFVKISGGGGGGQIQDPFLLVTRAVLRAQNWFRGEQDVREEQRASESFQKNFQK